MQIYSPTRPLKPPPKNRLKLIHRLDQFTTGVIIIGKGKASAKRLNRLFKDHEIKKTYIALVDGIPEQDNGTIENFINQQCDPKLLTTQSQQEGFKQAITSYTKLQTIESGLSILQLSPQTGRRHQLRIHTAETLMTPIIGDFAYHPGCYKKTNQQNYRANQTPIKPGSPLDIRTPQLHAHRIEFLLASGEKIEITAPLPQDRQKIWASVGANLSALGLN